MIDNHLIGNYTGINDSGINLKTELHDNSTLNSQLHEYSLVKDLKANQNEAETIAELKKQNSRLREELKQLSEQLSVILEKQKARRSEKPNIDQDLTKESLKGELENAQKQVQIYSKDIKTLKNRIEITYSNDRVSNLESNLREKERTIEKLTEEKRVLERINRDQERQLKELKEEYNKASNISAYTEEIRLLKQKIREVVERERKAENTAQKKHEYFISIEQKYRELCQKYGIEPANSSTVGKKNMITIDPNQIKHESRWNGVRSPHNKNDLIRSEANIRLHKKGNPNDEDEDNTQVTEEKFRELQNAIRVLKKAHLSNEKKYRGELELAQSKIHQLELEMNEISQKLREKEKESNIMNSKMNELKRTLRASTLPPLDGDIDGSKNKIAANTTKNKLNSRPIGATRKDERGRSALTDQEFNDQILLKDSKETRIIGFKLWYTDTLITGIQAIYRDSLNREIEGSINLSETAKSEYKEDSINLASGDHIKEICGFLDKDEKYVQCLILTSEKGESKRVGNSTSESKLFKLDINEYEYPSILYGAIEIQHDGEKESGSLLTKIGVIIRSDAVEEEINQKEFDNKKRNDSINALNRKYVSKSKQLNGNQSLK